ncbi:hypothetical protein JCM10450v2_000982 [Rhodotorula kratochvilovae]
MAHNWPGYHSRQAERLLQQHRAPSPTDPLEQMQRENARLRARRDNEIKYYRNSRDKPPYAYSSLSEGEEHMPPIQHPKPQKNYVPDELGNIVRNGGTPQPPEQPRATLPHFRHPTRLLPQVPTSAAASSSVSHRQHSLLAGGSGFPSSVPQPSAPPAAHTAATLPRPSRIKYGPRMPGCQPQQRENSLAKPTRSQHQHKEPAHSRTTGFSGSKKHGHGTANWGSEQDDILEGIALAHSDDFVSHSPADMGAQKLSMSPPTSPSLASTADKELQATNDHPEAAA